MLLISRPPPPKRAPQAMSIQSIHSELSSSSVSRTHVLASSSHPPYQEHHSPARRQYIRPALLIDCPPTPKHWDLASRVSNMDVREEDGYILSANGEEYTSGVFVPCEPLSAVRRARPGRVRIRPMALHRRRISGITTSISPTSVSASSSPSHQSLKYLFILTYLPITLLILNDQFPPSSILPPVFSSVIAFLPRP